MKEQLLKITFISIIIAGVALVILSSISAPTSLASEAMLSSDQHGGSEIANNAIILAEKPTKTPRPTITPPAIPPPQNVTQTNLMILFMILAVIIVVIGVWLNREKKH